MKAALLNLRGSLLPGILLVPLLVVFASWGQFEPQLWSHLAATVLPDYLWNSVLLAGGSGLLALLLGPLLAELWGWRVTMVVIGVATLSRLFLDSALELIVSAIADLGTM